MRKRLTGPLLAFIPLVAALLLVAPTPRMACTSGRVDCGALALLGSLTCATLFASGVLVVVLVVGAALHSVRQQRAGTAAALAPLLALPRATVPSDLAIQLGALRLETRTHVIACEAPVALCHGLLRPRLLLSTGALRGLSPAEVEAVLRHEQAHLCRRDPLRLIAARALAQALPAVPVLGQFAATLPVAQELAADRVALDAVGPDALAGALLKLQDGLGPLLGQTVAVGAFSPLDARIDQLMGAPPPSLSPSGRAVAGVGALLIVTVVLLAIIPVLWCALAVPAMVGLVRRLRRQRKATVQFRP